MPSTPTAGASVPFAGILREGSTGTQPVAVKRGLYRAGFRDGWADLDGPTIAQEVLGPIAVGNLRAFQHAQNLTADGVYGAKTHARLAPHFDKYAELLYRPAVLHLPAHFIPTHETAGLPGFPAIDVFARPGTPVYSPVAGVVDKLSGREPHDGGNPGGAYGWSIYITSVALGVRYFLTHFGTRNVELHQQVTVGTIIGTVCDAAVAHMASSASHIHEGRHET